MINMSKIIISNAISIKTLKRPLCFTAEDAGATITFNKVGEPDDASIVTSTDK